MEFNASELVICADCCSVINVLRQYQTDMLEQGMQHVYCFIGGDSTHARILVTCFFVLIIVKLATANLDGYLLGALGS